ncbi:MAG: UDP-N-acetylmuramate dehydrogenase [Bacilli bacterium]
MSIVKELKKIKCGKILTNVSLKEYTTYKIDGKAKVIVFPKNKHELINLIKYIKNHNIPYKILGNGSNLIFVKSVYEGILIKLSEFDDLKIDKNVIQVGAGYNLMKLALKVSRLGLTGLEFATGIPGSVGGAVYMNAGAYNSDMGYVVKMVKVLTPNLEIKEMTNREMDFHYRTSFLQKNPGYICLEATIVLRYGNKDIIMEIIKDRKERRVIGQPLEYPSAGSVFRNPKDDYAGRLIEDIGYKGKKIGGAEVSQKHANFIINTGGATGKDIYDLIMEIKDKVKEKYDIELKVEQEIVE